MTDMTHKHLVIFLLFGAAAALIPGTLAAVGQPQPGEVYREFTVVMTNASQSWRVTDPNTSNVNAQHELPNATHTINIPSAQLNGAVRAEMLFDYWGGHPGTVGQRFKFNNKPWINIPALGTTPQPATGNNRPECYMQQWNPVVPVPLNHLQSGNNVLHRTSGNQTCFSFNWGQWGSYAVTLRIYYNPAQVPNPTGSITSPTNGGSIGENPTIRVSASGGGGIARVDVLARVEAYDWDGDGTYTDWAQAYHRAKTAGNLDVSHHVGTRTSGPWNFVFNTELIPDQPAGAVRFLARIKGNNGLWYVTPVRQNISLNRAGSVRLFKPKDVPPRFWTRVTRRNLTSKVNVPSNVNLNDLVDAKLLVRTWNGVDGGGPGTHSTRVNNWKIPVTYGANHHYSADALDVQNNRIVNGDNIIKFDSPSTHHGVEILWPGPALLLRFGSAVGPFCGDGTVNGGEQCDDGNNTDGDGCNADCTLPAGGACGDGTVDPGEQCDDGNNNDDDGCTNACTLPPMPSTLPALYPFEGSGSTIVDASGNGNDGTLVGGASRTADGRFGAALEFDGNSGHVNLGTLDVGGSQGTWAAWLRPDDFGISDARALSKATSVMNDDHYWMLSTFQQGGLRHLRFRLKVAGTTITVIGTGDTLTAGQWVHAAATYDGSTIRLYQDGTLVASAAAAGPITGNGGVEAWIGDHVGGGKSFDGRIDELLIDDRAYTPAEIGDLVAGPLVGGPTCGDGNLDAGEECDDGNTASGDGCQAGCLLPVCGDGIQDPGEACDDGNDVGGDGCEDDCTVSPACGDGTVDPGEACDDGNDVGGDGCENDCTVSPFCGDGTVDPGEACDDGNDVGGDGCENDCTVSPFCGDGTVDPGEACDDGNDVGGDGCEDDCTISPACGDGVLDPGEACDDGNNVGGDGCEADCSPTPVCGNGVVETGEACDDGNNVDGDGCDAACGLEGGAGPPDSVTFFFNGEACTTAACSGAAGYTLHPDREHSAGDTTAAFNSRGQVARDAAITGDYGFASATSYDQMTYAVSGGDLLSAERGTVCMVVRQGAAAPAAAHRLFLVQSPNAVSYLNLDFRNPTDLRLRHRDADRVLTAVDTVGWGEAGGPGPMLIQISYDSTAATDSLRIAVDGITRAVHPGPLGSMDGLADLRFGNGTTRAGAYDYDQILLGSDPDFDCFARMAGVCSTDRSSCLSDDACGAGTCDGLVRDYGDLGSEPDPDPDPDLCPDDPAKDDPGVCGCGVPDVDTDGDGSIDCPGDGGPGAGDADLTFFFNGEACDQSACSGVDGYSLDPSRETSAGDVTASFNSQGSVRGSGAIFGQYGFEARTHYDQMMFDVVDGDLIPAEEGSVCMVLQNAGIPAESGHRLLLATDPGATSLLALEFRGLDDLRLFHRDLDRQTTVIHTGAWNGADTTDVMLVQLAWNATGAGPGLRLVVDGVERAASAAPVQPLGAIHQLRFGNSSGEAGAFRYDQLLISRRADLDCWEAIAGTCSTDPGTRCLDEADCPGAGTCTGVAVDAGDL